MAIGRPTFRGAVITVEAVHAAVLLPLFVTVAFFLFSTVLSQTAPHSSSSMLATDLRPGLRSTEAIRAFHCLILLAPIFSPILSSAFPASCSPLVKPWVWSKPCLDTPCHLTSVLSAVLVD